MEKKRPQLSLLELHQVRWLLGGLLALISVWSVWYLDVNAWALLLLTSGAALATLVRPSLPARWPKWVHRLAFPAVLAVLIFDFYTFGELLPAFVRLAILLLLYRVSTYRKRRDDLQLILLGLFLVVTTGVLTVSIGFALQIAVFAALALGLLFTRTLVDAAEAGRVSGDTNADGTAPSWTCVDWRTLFQRLLAVSDWRLWLLGGFLFSGLVALSALLFLAIPRFQVDSSLFLDRWMNKRSVSGFTDTLRFGEVSDIQKDDSVALHVESSDKSEIPADLYWRMVVLDEYRDHVFRMSTTLQALALSSEQTRTRIDAFGLPATLGNAQWTFYMEPGVSRYLPFLGGFGRLVFTEPQSFRLSRELRMIVLNRDPSTMKAYRIDRMDTSGSIREGADGSGWKLTPRQEEAQAKAHALLRELPFSETEREQWLDAVREFTEGQKLSSQDFTRRAIAWLHARHRYALKNELPRGEGDPLVRWAMSNQPGHCELFAGSFAMLARAAGFSARVVGGYLGGKLNGDFLVIRNSDAHAWCELYDGAGRWSRVDPTVPPRPEKGSDAALDEALRSRAIPETGWSARIDRLRMLWYRRIVNFDQNDQFSLAQTLRQNTEASGKRVQAIFSSLFDRARAFAQQPWGLHRIGSLVACGLLAFFLVWTWRTVGRNRWIVWRARRSTGTDPVRREAGRWLERLAERTTGGLENSEYAEVRADLQRLRFGPRETWTRPEAVFHRARSVFKKLRRESSTSAEGSAPSSR